MKNSKHTKSNRCCKKEHMGKTDYRTYCFTPKERIHYVLEGIGIIAIFGYFFYRSLYLTGLLFPFLVFYLKKKKETLCKKRKEELNIQFKESLISVNTSVQAGYSLENAVSEAYRDMTIFFGEDSMIAKELFEIKRGISNNCTLEEMFLDFGRRSGVEDIRNFADILVIAKRSGGNINEIIRTSVTVIEERVAVLQEIQTLTRARKLEQKIMNIIPFGIIFYVEFTSKGFFTVLYHNPAGIVIMTICLLIYVISYLLSEKITDIQV